MSDQYGVITRLLEKMGLAEEWHVVEPVPGGLGGDVWIQSLKQRLNAYVQLSPRDSDLLPEDSIAALIQAAIVMASDTRYRS